MPSSPFRIAFSLWRAWCAGSWWLIPREVLYSSATLSVVSSTSVLVLGFSVIAMFRRGLEVNLPRVLLPLIDVPALRHCSWFRPPRGSGDREVPGCPEEVCEPSPDTFDAALCYQALPLRRGHDVGETENPTIHSIELPSHRRVLNAPVGLGQVACCLQTIEPVSHLACNSILRAPKRVNDLYHSSFHPHPGRYPMRVVDVDRYQHEF
mmetsp:Transcript_29969/g.61682  ORF Transcript_29969/g.61682 Transcript_29969/m.61682 type:complete len:208 (-) Transcript_29969:1688-2311(-)